MLLSDAFGLKLCGNYCGTEVMESNNLRRIV